MLARKNATVAEPAELPPQMAAETPIDEAIDFASLQVPPGGRDPLLDSL